MSQYGPPGGMGNGPYGQQPEGQWQSGGAPNQPPYPGAPGYGQGPVENDPFGPPPSNAPGSGPPAPPPGAASDPFAPPPFSGAPGQPFGAPEQPSPPSGFEQPSPPGGFGPPPPAGGAPWAAPPVPPKKSRTGLVIGLVVVLVVVLGGAAGWYFVLGPGKSGGKSDNKQASGPVSASGVKAGDCVIHPKKTQTVKPASCSKSGALKVYKRFDHTTDKGKCPSPQTDFIYVYTDNSGGNNNFVLCLQTQGKSQGGNPTASPTS